jgi:hypothetical protein
MDYSVAAICISGAVFALQMFDRIWGGGSRTATAQAAIKEYVKDAIAELRKDVFLKHDTSEGNVGQAIQSIKDASHKMQLEAMEFRAVAAETYMRRDSYYKAMGELKADVNLAFEKLDKRLERMEGAMNARAK